MSRGHKRAEFKDCDFDKMWLKRFWTKYPSINNDSKKVREELQDLRLTQKDTKWAVTEKVHGANFCIAFNGKEFAAAKLRTFSVQNICYIYDD